MRTVWVLKASGERVPYNRKKLLKSCKRSGASTSACKEAIDKVERVLRDGMSTQEILKTVLGSLNKVSPAYASRYDLKGAIMRLGPAGFHFEKLTAELLTKHGYTTETNLQLRGKCVTHEIDILARKNNIFSLIECKFHQSPGIYTGLKETMYTWARLFDINEGAKSGKIEKAWLVSNTKFSDAAIEYATCRGVELTGWSYPKGMSYQDLLEEKELFPITAIKMDEPSLSAFAREGLMFVRDLVENPEESLSQRTGLSRNKIARYVELANRVLNPK